MYARKLLPWFERLYIMLMLGVVYYGSGVSLRLLFGRKSVGKVVAVSFAVTLLGMACRFLLEFGEVSNTYNFTPPNVALHLLAAVCLAALGARFGKDRSQAREESF